MTDYFALLDQPRQPWLDPEQLKQAFHKKTLEAHPDAQRKRAVSALEGSGGTHASTAFTAINEAYQTLRDPKRRLQHLLLLLGEAPSTQSASIPGEIQELFPVVANLTREIDQLAAKRTNASNALARSLLRAEAVQIEERLEETREILARLQQDALVRLKATQSADLPELRTLYLLFSYTSRWTGQLEERRLQLALPTLSS